jgi:hypothetical protein
VQFYCRTLCYGWLLLLLREAGRGRKTWLWRGLIPHRVNMPDSSTAIATNVKKKEHEDDVKLDQHA